MSNLSTEKYKYKNFKVYASTESLLHNQKRYRQVFERSSCSYIYAEFSFFNKKYEQEDWEMHLELRCYANKRGGPKEICKLPVKRMVNRRDNVVYVREGWGNKKVGAFWRKGAYYWEIYVDGVLLRRKDFYVEDVVRNSVEDNPFVALKSVRMFEGTSENVIKKEDRVYYKSFKQEKTRYLCLELILDNKMFGKAWYNEVFFRHFNEARELKDEFILLQKIDKKAESIQLVAKWGSNVEGNWRKGLHLVDIVVMDKLLATIPFLVGDEREEGIVEVLLPENQILTTVGISNEAVETFEEVMQELDKLIGLDEVKKQVRDHAQYIQFLNLRKEKGFREDEEINIHSVFMGNPGTGKTTVAKMMGRLYRSMGLLTKGHVHQVDRSDIVGEYIGQTAPKVKEAIERARGGVLFIDEAYALSRSNEDSKDFGREVIEILIKEMSDGEGDMAVIVAGYPKEMKGFLDSNPGLKSRFKIYFDFDDYLPQELSEIARYASEVKHVTFSPAAHHRIQELIIDAYRNRDRSFGNARFIFDIVEKAKVNLGLRIMTTETPENTDNETLETIELEDVKRIKIKRKRAIPHIPIDEQLLEASTRELENLIGMQSVKDQIKELIQLVRYYRDTNRDVLNKFYLHTIFVGNPGTGKTTVARILTKIYKALGVLERGHIIETDRQGLVAGYVGQTAIKTTERIDEAKGGVLFIDEAYALGEGSARGDFGNEAIQTILKRMEDNRGEFFVFAAGYPKNMDNFLKINPGLRSRFDKVLRFEDYSPEELLQIALMIVKEEELMLATDAQTHLEKYLNLQFDLRDNYFGNARTVRNIVTNIIKNQNLRLSKLSKSARSATALRTITLDDVQALSFDKENEVIYKEKRIGFGGRRGTQGA